MGRKLRGAALRMKKRSTEAAKEILETKAIQVEESDVRSKENEQLFILDTTAVISSQKQHNKKEEKIKKRKYQASAKEQAQIQKLLQGHSAEELKTLSQNGKAIAKNAKIKGAVKPTFDLWEEEANKADSTAIAKKQRIAHDLAISPDKPVAGIKPSSHVNLEKTVKALPAPNTNVVSIDLATAGQSYNPDKQEHKRAIEEALKVESKRSHADQEHKAPISEGLSAETKALLLGDSDTDDYDSDEEKEGIDGASTADDQPLRKRPEKLTRAQRNKQKRVRAELQEIRERKRQKKLHNAAGEARTIAKKLSKEEAEKQEQKEHTETRKNEPYRIKGKDVYQQLADENPRFAPAYPVALTNELKSGSSLRTMKPKGSLVTDRMVSLMDRDMVTKKQLKKKMRVEGKRRKVKVRGKGYEVTSEGQILG